MSFSWNLSRKEALWLLLAVAVALIALTTAYSGPAAKSAETDEKEAVYKICTFGPGLFGMACH